MKKPYLNQYQRIGIKNDTLIGVFAKLDLSFRVYERSMYRKYWIFAWIIIRLNIKEGLKPINEQIKRNWK